jgi:CheY-like chemotaxis protein
MANKKFDLVIMDMRMDAMDGYATTRAIRQEFPPDRQPVIAILTAGVTANQLNALQSAGIDAYLEKPITIDRLLHLVELVRLHEVSGSHNGQFEIVPLHPQSASVIDSGMDMKV